MSCWWWLCYRWYDNDDDNNDYDYVMLCYERCKWLRKRMKIMILKLTWIFLKSCWWWWYDDEDDYDWYIDNEYAKVPENKDKDNEGIVDDNDELDFVINDYYKWLFWG